MPATRRTARAGGRGRVVLRVMALLAAAAAVALLVASRSALALRVAVLCALLAAVLLAWSVRGAPRPGTGPAEQPNPAEEVRRLVRGEMNALRGEVADLRGAVGSVRAELRGDLRAAVQAELAPVRGEVGEMRGEVGEMRGEVGEVRRAVGEVRGELEHLRRDGPRWETQSLVAELTRGLAEGDRLRLTRDWAAGAMAGTGEQPRYVEPAPASQPPRAAAHPPGVWAVEPPAEITEEPRLAPDWEPRLPDLPPDPVGRRIDLTDSNPSVPPPDVDPAEFGFSYDWLPDIDHLPDPEPRGRHARH